MMGKLIFDGEQSMVKEINFNRRRFLGTAAMTIAAAQFGAITFAKTRTALSPRLRNSMAQFASIK